MGNEMSGQMVADDTPPETLEKRDIASVAKYITSGRARKIAIMVGEPKHWSRTYLIRFW
jgi:hypothetical protein